ncbi:partial DNA polymerase III subunit alpha, partial [Rhodocyclaceae bacterium]
LGEARARFAKSLRLSLNGGSRAETAARLRDLLAPYRSGGCPVRLAYRNGDAEAELALPDDWRVRLDDALLDSLTGWLSADNVRVVYS